DTITVEVEDRFTLTGTAIVNPNKSVDVAGAGWSFARQPDGSWRTDYSLIKATLIAHTPAEPEWHRAKVIKADTVRDYGFYLVQDKHSRWWDNAGNPFSNEECTNVTIIVD